MMLLLSLGLMRKERDMYDYLWSVYEREGERERDTHTQRDTQRESVRVRVFVFICM